MMSTMPPENHLVVAIDGPAGAGKSTIARRLAEKLGFIYIDTGAMYRCVGLLALRQGIAMDDAAALERVAHAARIEFAPASTRVFLNGEDVTEAIRSAACSSAASQVSTIAGVRRAMVEQQRAMGAGASVVMEGRDIGSVVFPDAGVKIFLDAEPGVRANRRVLEMEEKGGRVQAQEIVRQMNERDQRDRTRAEAPLVQAPGAIRVDTTALDIDGVEGAILNIIRDSLAHRKEPAR